MTKEIVILLGGDIEVTSRLRDQVRGKAVIAADGGIKHADKLGVIPSLWMGDFDSSSNDLMKRYANIERESFSVEKDKTDGEIAINKAISLGFKEIILAGAFGGNRVDHAMAHVLMASKYVREGIKLLLTSGNIEAYILSSGDYNFDFPAGSLFSILPLTSVQELTILGSYWELQKYDLEVGETLTLSNKVVSQLHINLSAGEIVLFFYPD